MGARQLPGRRGQEGGRVLCEQHRPGAVDGWGGAGRHRRHDHLPEAFPGAARTELESQLQRAVKVSAKSKHVKCKMDLERCLFWDPAGNRVPPAEFVRRRGSRRTAPAKFARCPQRPASPAPRGPARRRPSARSRTARTCRPARPGSSASPPRRAPPVSP